MWKEIISLINKELITEFRQRYALTGVLLYVVATVFISYLSFQNIIEVSTWNALFWTIVLFASVNASAKSFLQESKGHILYYYTLISPQTFLLSKIIYNCTLVIILSLVCFGFYSLFMGNIIENFLLFLLTLVLSSIGISSLLSIMSAIASKANNNFTVMAILSFPLITPMLIVTIRTSHKAINGSNFDDSMHYIAALISLDVIVITLGYLLFPYLWKD